jgi:hypothetical protein
MITAARRSHPSIGGRSEGTIVEPRWPLDGAFDVGWKDGRPRRKAFSRVIVSRSRLDLAETPHPLADLHGSGKDRSYWN